MTQLPDDPADVNFSYATDAFPPFQRKVIRAVEKVSGQGKMRQVYERHVLRSDSPGGCFFEQALGALRLTVRFDQTRLAAIPKDGPVLFVANHPFGVIDGIGLAWLSKQARPDVKVMAHSVLCQPPAARPNLLPIDFDETREAMATSARSRRQALAWLKEGGAVGLFPGGGIATSLRAVRGRACDLPWHPFVGKLAMTYKPTVVPVFFEGQNSRLFQMASHVSNTLRLSLIFHETARRMGTTIEAKIGPILRPEDYEQFGEKTALAQFLRRQTMGLADQSKRPMDPDAEYHLKS